LFVTTAHISVHNCATRYVASNVTGRHQGPKRKLRAGHRAPSLQRTFSSASVVSRAFSAVCVYSKFGHHPHP